MSSTKNKISYDKKFDVLYFCIDENDNSYGDEIDDSIVFMKDIETNNITGITVMDYLKIYHNNIGKLEKLKPFFDLSEVANKCENMD